MNGKQYGFGDELDDLSALSDNGVHDIDSMPPKKAVKKVAEAAGWTSRDPDPMAIFSVRAPKPLIKEFKDLAATQTPKWPHAYVLERALEALKREIDGYEQR